MKKRIGVMECPEKTCKGTVVVRQDEGTATLSWRCEAVNCDTVRYVKATEPRHAAYLKAITRDVSASGSSGAGTVSTSKPAADSKPAPVKESFRMPGT